MEELGEAAKAAEMPVKKREKMLVRDPRGRVVERVRPPHGLAATDRMFVAALNDAERSVFQKLRADLRREFQPESASDALLVEQTALAFFRYLRACELDYRIGRRVTYLSGVDHETQIREKEVLNLERISRYEAQIEKTLRLNLEKLLAKKNRETENERGYGRSSSEGGSSFFVPRSSFSSSRRERINS